MPVMRSTISGVYREYCCFNNWKTQRGCTSERSYAVFGGSIGGGFVPPCPEAPTGPAAWCPPPVSLLISPWLGLAGWAVEGLDATARDCFSKFVAGCWPCLF